MKLAFVCEGNAGRSQFATAFAERERDERGADVTIVTGGVDPGDHVHPEVRAALEEVGIDIEGREPRQIRPADVADADYVVTMGCTIEDFRPEGWDGENRVWDLEHPGGESVAEVRDQRDEIARRVEGLFDEIGL